MLVEPESYGYHIHLTNENVMERGHFTCRKTIVNGNSQTLRTLILTKGTKNKINTKIKNESQVNQRGKLHNKYV